MNTGYFSRKCNIINITSIIIISYNVVVTIIILTKVYSLIALLETSLTSTVISVDEDALRTNTGCAVPFSIKLYVDWLNITVISTRQG